MTREVKKETERFLVAADSSQQLRTVRKFATAAKSILCSYLGKV